MTQARPVFVVDDDELMCEELTQLLQKVGYDARAYPTADAFLTSYPEPTGVLIIDLRLKGVSGLRLQQKLQGCSSVQIIFMSGVAYVEDAVAAMKAGAYEFLVKPFRPQALIDAVDGAFERLCIGQLDKVQLQAATRAYQSLTEAEREIAHLLASGLRNKQVAYRSGRAESTVKVHRAWVMKKMGVTTLVDLSRQLQWII